MGNHSDLGIICYKQNPLKEVIARVDLVSPIEAIGKELPKLIAKAALKDFPIDEPRPAFTQEFLISAQELHTRKVCFRQGCKWPASVIFGDPGAL